jgi:hypothetical protein
MTTSLSLPELIVFTKQGGPLTKRISLNENTIRSDGSACVMARGEARRLNVADVRQLATSIENLDANQAIGLGQLRAGLPNEVKIVTKDKLNGEALPNVIARTGDDIIYQKGQSAFALLDFDTKGMPRAVKAELTRWGGFWPALISMLPELATIARVTRPSTSAGLYRADTGERLQGSDGVHVYVQVKDGEDVERFLKILHERCWLAGFGWYMIGAGGQLLDRSIVDRMVGAPERLIFEGGPILEAPLEQDQESRRPIAVDGETLDTLAAVPPLTIIEKAALAKLKAEARQKIAPAAAKARDEFVARQTQQLANRTGMPIADARYVIERQCAGVLYPDLVLPFDDDGFAGVTVRKVLADPDRFEGATLADRLRCRQGEDYAPRGRLAVDS